MRLLLTSEGGFPTQEIVDACIELVGKPASEISFAVINEAYPGEPGDKRWVIMQLNAIATKFGGPVELVNLRALSSDQVVDKMADCDAIYCVGGHTDFLMRTFIDTGFDTSIRDTLETKVWVGSSAGSMVLGHRTPVLVSETELTDGNEYGIDSYLELVDFGICPHVDRIGYPSTNEELRRTFGSQPNVPIYGIADDAAVVVDGDKVSFIGTEPLMIFRNT